MQYIFLWLASEGNGSTVGAYITSDKRGKKSVTTTWMTTDSRRRMKRCMYLIVLVAVRVMVILFVLRAGTLLAMSVPAYSNKI